VNTENQALFIFLHFRLAVTDAESLVGSFMELARVNCSDIAVLTGPAAERFFGRLVSAAPQIKYGQRPHLAEYFESYFPKALQQLGLIAIVFF
jgi:hypothetical protein